MTGTWDEQDYLGKFINGSDLYKTDKDHPDQAVDPTGEGCVDCIKAVANLLKANALLVRRVAEATVNINQGHIKAIGDAMNGVANAEILVAKHCGGTFLAAEALMAADSLKDAGQKAIDAANQAITGWEESGDPLPIP